jgi:hypothetical protein
MSGMAVVFIAVPAVCGRLLVRVITRRARLRPGWLMLAAASLAAVACGGLVQDAAADAQAARLDPRVAGLLASHVHPDIASKAVSIASLTEPPELWFMTAMAVMFLNVKRRSGSTARITAAAGVSLGIATALNAVLPGWDRHDPVSLGAAAVAALGITTAPFARHRLGPRQAKIAAAGIGAAADFASAATAGRSRRDRLLPRSPPDAATPTRAQHTPRRRSQDRRRRRSPVTVPGRDRHRTLRGPAAGLDGVGQPRDRQAHPDEKCRPDHCQDCRDAADDPDDEAPCTHRAARPVRRPGSSPACQGAARLAATSSLPQKHESTLL